MLWCQFIRSFQIFTDNLCHLASPSLLLVQTSPMCDVQWQIPKSAINPAARNPD